LELICFFLEELFGDFEDLETGEKSKEDDDQMDYDGKIKFFIFIYFFCY
jgi:hypothetical protein